MQALLAGYRNIGLRCKRKPHAFPCSRRFSSTATTAGSTLSPKRRKIRKLLAANRGEIAIRVFRAATELNIETVAIYSHDDQLAAHRYKADEAYRVGKGKSPVSAYLAMDEIIGLARNVGVDAIHPGYGFLSENAQFAQKCADNDIIFVGPSAQTLHMMGDKTAARDIAKACNVPIVPGTDGPVSSLAEVEQFVAKYGYPIIIKAAFGGGGRGMRVVRGPETLEDSFQRCQSEGNAFFGNGTVFIERYLENPRHVEVQLLGDLYGNIVHLYDRDCSIQRRHQKVVEIAPATATGGLSKTTRDNILADAVKIAKHVNYSCAGTAEFLVDKQQRYYFIEVNPRIQVEHTVTEEVTGVDLVQSQILVSGGTSLPELHLTQDQIMARGCAIQCRVTTEDPENNFQPDTGRISMWRPGEGMGIRLDAGSGHAGAVISPHYDSLLVKVTGRGRDYRASIEKLIRALKEFRVRGVKTNIPFVMKVLTHPSFVSGDLDTGFIERYPELFNYDEGLNRAEKIMAYLGHLRVNGVAAVHPGATGSPPSNEKPRKLIPHRYRISEVGPPTDAPPPGWRNILLKEGPVGFGKKIREHKKLLLTDTTMRDAHQSLLATRMRTVDMLQIAPFVSHLLPGLFSLENWGGATFDVAMRFLRECPWDRLVKLRELIPNIPFQMLLRGANAVGYTSYPDNTVREFCRLAVKHGMDIFRVFDSLNYVENLKLGIDAVGEAGGVIEASICYTGDVSDPKKGKYTLEYYLNLVRELEKLNIHILNIKDMAGLLKPQAATLLIGAIRREFPHMPIHVHTHDTAGTGVASMLACYDAGADVVDGAIDSMSGTTSQPSLGAIVASLNGKSDVNFDHLQVLNDYWESVRTLYGPFESGQKTGSSDVYVHEMPGGQYTNLLFQSHQLGLTGRWPAIKKAYATANLLLGDIVKVTPSSKVVGDLAQFMVQNDLNSAEEVLAKADTLSFPSSVTEYFEGKLGQPFGGFPEPLRTKVLRGKKTITGRPGASMADYSFEDAKNKLVGKFGTKITETDVMSYAMYPQVTEEFMAWREEFGDLSVLPTKTFFSPTPDEEETVIYLDAGKKLVTRISAVGSTLDDKGTREVFFELNGIPRSLRVQDMEAKKTVVTHEKATTAPGSVGAPMPGAVIFVKVTEGDKIQKGAPLLILSAMKMETVVSAPIAGTVKRVVAAVGQTLTAGDLLVEIEP